MKKVTFENTYPLFARFIYDDEERKELLTNNTLFIKYINYNESIRCYLYELDKFFHDNQINDLIYKTIVEPEEQEMISFIVSYLNSDVDIKNNINAYELYNNNLDNDRKLRFIEKYGITCEEKNIDSFNKLKNLHSILTIEYKNIAKMDYQYNGESIKDEYSKLSLPKKVLINSLVKSNTLDILEKLFDENNTLDETLNICIEHNIDTKIINTRVLSIFNYDELKALINYIIKTNDNNFTNNIKIMINIDINLLKNIINNNKIEYIKDYNSEEINEEIICKIKSRIKMS